MHIPGSWVVSIHICSDVIIPECIELIPVSRLIEAASAVWDPFGYDFLDRNGSQDVHHSICTDELWNEVFGNVEVH